MLAALALEVLKEQRDRHEKGLLFRGLRGKRLGLQALTMRFERLSEKVGRRVCSYDFRHTWSTRALKAGIPVAHVAAMLGHSSTAMVSRHYGHLSDEVPTLRDAADRVSKAG